MTSLKACEVSGFSIERQDGVARATVTQRVDGCVDCNGTGLLRTQVKENGRVYDVASPCPRARMERRVALFNDARVPAVHAQSTFDSYKPANAEQAQALKVAKDFALGWPSKRGFGLSGPVGTGKTHLLAAVLSHLTLQHGVACGYVEISLLFAQIRRGFQEGKSGGEIIGPLAQLHVLAIDELGKGRGTPFELDTLDELIARRYNAGRITLFGTNYSLKPPEGKRSGVLTTDALLESAKESKLLCDRVGDRIYSRLCELCDFVEFPPQSPDQRRARLR